MTLALEILGILAPGACLALIGLAWHRRGPAFPLDFVTTLVVNVSLPGLLFHTLVTSGVPFASLGRIALATLVVHLVFAPLAMGLLRAAGKDWRLGVAHVVGNTGNLGLPVCLFAFGPDGLAYAMAFFAVQCTLLFSLGEAVYAGSLSLRRTLRSPILWSIALAVAVRAGGVGLPAVALETLALVGQITIPLMLITLGVSLGSMRAASLPSALGWSAVRTATAAAVGFGVAAAFGLEGVARGVLVIETVVPVAVFNYLLAARHGRDAGDVTGLILVTHLGAIAYLPLVLAAVLG